MPSLENTLQLAAPLARVWAVLTETDRYAAWNPRLLRIEGSFSRGAVVTLHYLRDRPWLPARFVVDVDVVEPERELRWSGPRNAARSLFRASHFFQLSPRATGTQLTHGETFEGVLAPVLWPLLRGPVAANHRAVNDAIRARCDGS